MVMEAQAPQAILVPKILQVMRIPQKNQTSLIYQLVLVITPKLWRKLGKMVLHVSLNLLMLVVTLTVAPAVVLFLKQRVTILVVVYNKCRLMYLFLSWHFT
ncbi:hypothetical protein KMI_06g10440 [Encephalitozoon hellem]|nr:hypothetical protein KMI_06g10440 [Encephalitozoon hellem]